MSQITIDERLMDLRLNLSRLEGIVEEVERHIADGKPDSAVLVLGSQDGKIARFNSSYSALYTQLLELGANPERAMGRA